MPDPSETSTSPRRPFSPDWFLIGLVVVVGLAYLAPKFGSKAGPLPLDAVARYGVSAIFFFYGLRLSLDKLRAGLRNGWLHVVVQLTTFGFFPLLALAVRGGFSGTAQAPLWTGIFFLAALPSTVSSSVVMVSLARGNLPAAIFNASISSLIGIVITPLWVSAILGTLGSGASGDGTPLWGMMGDLALRVALPVVLGMALNPRLGTWAGRHSGALRSFDQGIILLTIYTSFCESFAGGQFRAFSLGTIFALGAGMLALFFGVYGLVSLVCRLFGFSAEDRITTLFCGSKKSLVHGTVFSQVLFSGSASLGVLLLPLMLYHALQILVGSVLAKRWGRRDDAESKVQR